MTSTPAPPTAFTDNSNSNDNNTSDESSVHQVAPTSLDSCTWYHNSECRQPRTCFDCLNVQLPNDVCTVNPNGVCVSQSTYDPHLAKRSFYVPLQRYFSSSDYRYCSANDSVCATCHTQWKQQDPGHDSTSSARSPSYCKGHNGCVCISNCEAPNWHDVVVEKQCPDIHDNLQPPLSIQDGTGLSMPVRVTVSVVVGIAVTLLVVFATCGVRRLANCRGDERLVIHRDRRLRPGRMRLQLSLTGWNSLRQKLIDTERQSFEPRTPLSTFEGRLAPVLSGHGTETSDAEDMDDELREWRVGVELAKGSLQCERTEA